MKKLFSILIILTFITTLFVNNAFAQKVYFTDHEGHEYEEAIQYLFDEGIIKGYASGYFLPDETINRAELLKIVVETQYEPDEFNSFYGDTCFDDIPEDAWFSKYVCFAKSKGIVAGYGDGTFQPERTVSLNETLKMIYETMNLTGPDPNAVFKFKYYSPAMLSGYIPDDLVAGYEELLTRGEVSEIIYRVIQDEDKVYKEDFSLNLTLVQQKYKSSCATGALTSALSARITLSEDDVINRMIDIGLYPNNPIEKLGDKYVWDDPQKVFVGDYDGFSSIYMYKLSGFGFFEEPLEKLTREWAPNSEKFTNENLYFIAREVLEGNPVIVFANVNARSGRVISTESSDYSIQWYTRDDDRLINAPMYKHNLVVEGFRGTLQNPEAFYIMDPFYGDKIELTPLQLNNIMEGYGHSGVVVKY